MTRTLDTQAWEAGSGEVRAILDNYCTILRDG